MHVHVKSPIALDDCRISEKPPPHGLAVSKPNLGIAWIDQELKICAFTDGLAKPLWSGVIEPGELGMRLKAVLSEYEFQTREATAIVSTPELVCQRVTPPAVEPRQLHRLLANKAQEIKPFSESAIWSYFKTNTAKGGRSSYFLQVLQRERYDVLLKACFEQDIHIHGVFTPIDGLLYQLKSESGHAADTTLIVCEIANAFFLLIGDAAGSPVHARVFRSRLVTDAPPTGEAATQMERQRVRRKIQRSIEYAATQLGVSAQRIVAVGDHDYARRLSEVLEQDAQPSQGSVAGVDIFNFHQLSRLPKSSSRSLIPRETHQRARQENLLRLGLAATLAVTIAVIGYVGATELKIAEINGRQLELTKDERATLVQKSTAEEEIRGAQSRIDALRAALENQPQPDHYWIPVYIHRVLPPHWVLTHLRAQPSEDGAGIQLRLRGARTDGEPISDTERQAFRVNLYHEALEIQRPVVGPLLVSTVDAVGAPREVNGFSALIEFRIKEESAP